MPRMGRIVLPNYPHHVENNRGQTTIIELLNRGLSPNILSVLTAYDEFWPDADIYQYYSMS